METEEALDTRESAVEYYDLRTGQAYQTFLAMLSPKFLNVFHGVFSHLFLPLSSLFLLVIFSIVKKKFKSAWDGVAPYISPFLLIAFICQCLRYAFLVHNVYMGDDRVPTTRIICSLSTYSFSALNYVPHFVVTVILLHRILSMHLRPLAVRELHFALGGMLLAYIILHGVHLSSRTLELGWICRPYLYNKTVLLSLHWALTICTFVNPLAAAYLYWAECMKMNEDQQSKKALYIFYFTVSALEAMKLAAKGILELVLGFWGYVHHFIVADEAARSLYFSIVLLILLMSFKEFRDQMIEWFRFSKKPKVELTSTIIL